MHKPFSLAALLGLLASLDGGGTAVELRAESAFNVHAHDADVDGARLHYLEAGAGETLLLIHGYSETSHMWRAIMPALAQRFHVIAPDLPGIGDSSIPETGLDIRAAGERLHTLLRSLHLGKASVVGHDIGLMVAYGYAAQFPSEVDKLVVMDARTLPGVPGWADAYQNPAMWHYGFHGPTAEALVTGRERIYFERFWNDFAADSAHSLSERDRRLYVAAYSRPGRMRAAWAYFAAFPQTAREFALLSKNKLPMPVLVLTGERAAGDGLAAQMRGVANDVTARVLPNTGHWLLEERRDSVLAALAGFL
jgi:pimeloyl-ACP methyl ester carboxylesterase